MNKRIWKYAFPVQDYFEIELPHGAEIVHIGVQDTSAWHTAEMWVIFDSFVGGAPLMEKRNFRVFGTGHEIPIGLEYIDTFMDGRFVWHLFEGYRG